MSGDGRLRESRANIVIVPTTTPYEIEPSQRDRGPRKRGHLAVLTGHATVLASAIRCCMTVSPDEATKKI